MPLMDTCTTRGVKRAQIEEKGANSGYPLNVAVLLNIDVSSPALTLTIWR